MTDIYPFRPFGEYQSFYPYYIPQYYSNVYPRSFEKYYYEPKPFVAALVGQPKKSKNSKIIWLVVAVLFLAILFLKK